MHVLKILLLCTLVAAVFAKPKPSDGISFRFAHAVPNLEAVDILVDGDAKWKNIKYAEVATDVYLEPTQHCVEVRTTKSKESVVNTTISLFVPTTLAITPGIETNDIEANPYLDIPIPAPDQKRTISVQQLDLAFRNFGVPLDTIEVKRDNVLFSNSQYLQQINYQITDSGFQKLEWTPTGDPSEVLLYIPFEYLRKGSFYTFFVFGDLSCQEDCKGRNSNLILTVTNDDKHVATYQPGKYKLQ